MSTKYPQFIIEAEKHFATIQQKHPSSFQCAQGCTQCCESGLTTLPIEAQNIATYIQENPDILEALRTHTIVPDRCDFLSTKGDCYIYPVRPFICRSHGAPIAIAEEGYFQIDVCPLNFTENPIEELPPEDFFILDAWNEVLLNFHAITNVPAQRVPLTLTNFLPS